MKNKFTFRPLAFSDVPLMHTWFNLPHVQKFYSLRQWTEKEVLEKLKPYIVGEKPVLGFIVLMNDVPIGYIQRCSVKDYPWPNQNLSQEVIDNAVGVDLFIGDNALVGKGVGGQVMQAFIDNKLKFHFEYCLVDPDVRNMPAIKCYQKLNFRDHATIETSDALGQPVTLRLMILKLNP